MKEIVIHTHISDGLEETHPLANESVYCETCKGMLHASNNECMQSWFETDIGNFCTNCFVPGDGISEECDLVLCRRFRVGNCGKCGFLSTQLQPGNLCMSCYEARNPDRFRGNLCNSVKE